MALKRFYSRGQIFSMIAILMSALLVLLFSSSIHIPLDQDASIVKAEVNQLSSFVDDLGFTVGVASKSATFSILHALVEYHNGSNFIADPIASFISCFENNTFQPSGAGIWINCSQTEDVSFTSQLNDLFVLANTTFGVSANATLLLVEFNQSTPYSVETSVLLDLTVVKGSSIRWDRLLNLTHEVSFVGINDPLLMAFGINQSIQFRPYDLGHFVSSVYFHANFTMYNEYMDNSWYYKDNTSHSFFDMLQGNFPTTESDYHPFGITSFINVTAIPNATWSNHTSFIEHHFFSKYYNSTFIYDESDLRRINNGTIDDDFLYSLTYHKFIFDAKNDTPSLMSVEACCFDHPTRCEDACS